MRGNELTTLILQICVGLYFAWFCWMLIKERQRSACLSLVRIFLFFLLVGPVVVGFFGQLVAHAVQLGRAIAQDLWTFCVDGKVDK